MGRPGKRVDRFYLRILHFGICLSKITDILVSHMRENKGEWLAAQIAGIHISRGKMKSGNGE